MGFDLAITCTLHICPETGKPFYYGTDPTTHKITKVYEMPDIEVPEELKPYLQMRGHHLHTYIKKWDEENIYLIDTEIFLEKYISWNEYRASCDSDYADEDYWTEKDHNNLRLLLEWCAKQSINFQVSWSY